MDESIPWNALEDSTTAAAHSTAVLAISNELICFNQQMILLHF